MILIMSCNAIDTSHTIDCHMAAVVLRGLDDTFFSTLNLKYVRYFNKITIVMDLFD